MPLARNLSLAQEPVPKPQSLAYPTNLPPGLLQQLIPIRVLSVETLRADCLESLSWNNHIYESGIWREQLDAAHSDQIEVVASYENGEAAIVRNERFTYMATLTNRAFLLDFFQQQCQQADIQTYRFGEDIRISQRGNLMFAFNYSQHQQVLPLDPDTNVVLGSTTIEPHGVTVWKI